MSFRPGIADSVAGLLIALLLCCLAENKKGWATPLHPGLINSDCASAASQKVNHAPL